MHKSLQVMTCTWNFYHLHSLDLDLVMLGNQAAMEHSFLLVTMRPGGSRNPLVHSNFIFLSIRIHISRIWMDRNTPRLENQTTNILAPISDIASTQLGNFEAYFPPPGFTRVFYFSVLQDPFLPEDSRILCQSPGPLALPLHTPQSTEQSLLQPGASWVMYPSM